MSLYVKMSLATSLTSPWCSFIVLCYCLLLQQGVHSATAPSIVLANGNPMPQLGMGTSQITNDSVLEQRVVDAIDIGYRHIDTAHVYQNERVIGRALKRVLTEGKVKREELFITTKVWSTFHKRNSVMNSALLSLANLGLDYVDMLLVHWPMAYKEGAGWMRPDYNKTSAANIDTTTPLLETWRGMEDVLQKGLAKNIGVSNFNSEQLMRLLQQGYIKPATNQIECNPNLSQVHLVDFCQSKGISITAYAPLGRADSAILNDIVLNEIATAHNKTVPQVMLRWLVQRNIIAIPRTSNRNRLVENFNVFDFELNDAEMSSIFSLNKYKRKFTYSESKANKEWPFERIF